MDAIQLRVISQDTAGSLDSSFSSLRSMALEIRIQFDAETRPTAGEFTLADRQRLQAVYQLINQFTTENTFNGMSTYQDVFNPFIKRTIRTIRQYAPPQHVEAMHRFMQEHLTPEAVSA